MILYMNDMYSTVQVSPNTSRNDARPFKGEPQAQNVRTYNVPTLEY